MDHNYDKFKTAIAEELNEIYSVDLDKATKICFSKEFDNDLMGDIIWAQHMGVEYWAEVVVEYYLDK